MAQLPNPLAGLKVVEVAHDIGGEFAGLLLAQMGAEVVKVEPPEGSPTRRVGPFAKGQAGAQCGLCVTAPDRQRTDRDAGSQGTGDELLLERRQL